VVLEKAGLKEVYNVSHGFEGDLDDSHHRNSHNGWRFDGLPWVQTQISISDFPDSEQKRVSTLLLER
jgi:hypothetical protein